MTNENKIERALNILLDMQHAIAPEGVDAQYEVRSRLSQIDQCAGLWLCLWFLQYCRQILGIPVLEC